MNRKIYNFLWFIKTQIGINPLTFINSLKFSIKYLVDLYKFKKIYRGRISIKPSLQDFNDQSGKISEYTVQDLFVAQKIFLSKPKHHVDIGSRVDGFITNISTFMKVEIFDIRELKSFNPNITSKKVDIFSNLIPENYTKSLSCLHTIEHFGLGRYGDDIIHNGLERGLAQLSKILKKDGLLYLSTPVGNEMVEFNSNWIFDLKKIIDVSKTHDLQVLEIFILNKKNNLFKQINIDEINYEKLNQQLYNLSLIIFNKI